MHWLDAALTETANRPSADTLSTLQNSIDPQWIEQALAATGSASLRKRRLPAEQVVWLVLGMALLRDYPIDEVVRKLELVMPGERDCSTVARSSIVEARQRLGPEPMKWLFDRCSQKWAAEHAAKQAWRGLSVFAVDGTNLRVADSGENREEFGVATGPRGESGYPLVRLATLMAVRSHLLLSARFGSYSTSEHTLADDCLGALVDDSITIVDKNFLAAKYLVGIPRSGKNRHWLVRAKSSTSYQVLEQLGPGDAIVELAVSHEARKNDPTLPRTIRARAISYRFPDSKGPQCLLTSLLDSGAYPADELVQLYHERWEIELGYNEIKTHLLEREETIRSRRLEGVHQELWGILLAYNLVRLEMVHIADQARVEPRRISFIMATRYIREQWFWRDGASPGAIPGRLRKMRSRASEFVLPERRRHRRFPRAVKLKMSNYPRKRRPSDPAATSIADGK